MQARPTTPMVYGCSFSLLSFDLKVGQPPAPHYNSQYYQNHNYAPYRTQRNTCHGQRYVQNNHHRKIKEKKSLKNRKSPLHSLNSIDSNVQSPQSSSSAIEKQQKIQYQQFSQFSSVLDRQNNKPTNIQTNQCSCACTCKTQNQNQNSNNTTKKNTKTGFRSHNPSNSNSHHTHSHKHHISNSNHNHIRNNINYDKQNHNPHNQAGSRNTETILLTDDITLNQQSIIQEENSQRGRQFAIVNQSILSLNKRRVHTQANRENCSSPNTKVFIERPNNPVTRSQYFNNQESNKFSPCMTASTLPKKEGALYNQLKTPRQTMPRTSRSNFNDYFQTGVQTDPYQQAPVPSSLPIHTPKPPQSPQSPAQHSSQLQIHHPQTPQPLHLLFNQSHSSHVSHIRKVSSPRFEKPFRTLLDFNCKNVASSGGDKTSSNHISIVGSQDLNGSKMDGGSGGGGSGSGNGCGNGEFVRVIKMMTLKAMPMKEEVWSARSREN